MTRSTSHIANVLFITGLLLFMSSSGVFAQPNGTGEVQDSSYIQTLDKFRKAIISGDRVLAGKELTQNAYIMQAGERATRDQFIYKHIIPECEYVYSVNQKVEERIVRQMRDVAWISSIYLVTVTHEDGNSISRKLAELAILKKRNEQWKIDMIHWSNCPSYTE